jgi:MFS family permease
MKFLTRTIWILSLVSLFTDTASEMLYPVMPIYLKSIGFSVILIGILEGIAEAVAGLSKGYFGELSDKMEKRAPFIQFGYSLSALSKPMLAFFTWPLWVFFGRTLDRIGKGIRTGARDAMLSDEATPETKGKIFGFHRAMDTLGAVLGPLSALIFLYYYPTHYKTLFLIAFIPGVAAILASLLLKDKKKEQVSGGVIQKKRVTFFSSLYYWKSSKPVYRKLLTGLLWFALFNSSDAFLLMKIKHAGMNDLQVIALYIFYNLIYAALAFPAGIIADKIGLRKMFYIGIALFSITYFGFAFSDGIYYFGFLMLLYGAYAAATEGISKAWITNICEKKDTATAVGLYSGLQSLSLMTASIVAGIIWKFAGPEYVFLLSGITGIIVVFFFIINRSLLVER